MPDRPLRILRASLPSPAPPSLGRRIGWALAPYAICAVVAVVVSAGLAVCFRFAVPPGKTEWKHPFALLALVAVPALAVFYFHLHNRRTAPMAFTRTSDLRAVAGTFTRHLVHLPRALRLGAVALLAIALGRPERPSAEAIEVEGIDIVIALDVSNSMSEADLKPNRLAAAKQVIKKFVTPRESDRIGLVIFGREAFTQCPLTLDHRALATLLDDVRLDLIDGRGTAIGNALGTALNRLRKSDAKSKVIILLTDGDNNAGNLAPEQAARYAQALGVKVFTILMGRDADAAKQQDDAALQNPFANLFPPRPRYPVNPKLLEQIAGTTGGTPYLATDTPALERRFQSILDELDRSRLRDQRGKPRQLYPIFVAFALALLLGELALAMTRFRRFP